MDSSWFVICPDWSIAQTFTAELSGQMEKVDLYLENIFDLDLYPSTVSIVNTIDGVPSGSVLGTLYADILVEVANQLGAEEAIFAGWSLGGHILMEASSRLSNAKGMVLFGTPPVGNPPNMADAFLPGVGTENIFKGELTDEDVASWARGQFNDGADIPPSFTEDIKRTDGRAREYLGKSFGNLCYRDELKAVDDLKVPLAIFHGENDGCVNLHYLNKLNVSTLWRGEVQLITGAGHTPQWEEAERFNDLLNDFIEEI